MRSWQGWKAWRLVLFAALAAVVAFASPAAALEPTTTTVQASPSAATVGQSVTLTASVTCTSDPSGGLGVTFFDGSTLLDTVPVGTDGQATYTTSFATTGNHEITAAYNGNEICAASNSTTTVAVSDTPPPTPPAGNGCLLLCGVGLIDQSVGDIHNEFH